MSRIKFALYIFEGGELEEVVTGLHSIKKYISKYENNTKGAAKEVQTDSRKTQGPVKDS